MIEEPVETKDNLETEVIETLNSFFGEDNWDTYPTEEQAKSV